MIEVEFLANVFDVELKKVHDTIGELLKIVNESYECFKKKTLREVTLLNGNFFPNLCAIMKRDVLLLLLFNFLSWDIFQWLLNIVALLLVFLGQPSTIQ